jgi:hypothetical protein
VGEHLQRVSRRVGNAAGDWCARRVGSSSAPDPALTCLAIVIPPLEAGLGGVRILELRLDAIEVRYGEKQIPRFARNDNCAFLSFGGT